MKILYILINYYKYIFIEYVIFILNHDYINIITK